MELPEGFKEETVISVWHVDLEKFVYEVWGKKYDIAQVLDHPSNDSYYDYHIDEESYEGDYILDQGKSPAWLNDTDGWFDLQRVVERLESGFWLAPGPEDVLTALCEAGKLPAGNYQMKYYW